MTPPKSWLLAIPITLIAVFAIMRGYDLDRTRPSERYIYHVIPIALSVLYYHWPYDYTGSRVVESAIVAHRDSLSPTIRDVALHPENYQDNGVYFWRADDRGTLDFTVAAFYLFGPKIKSMAYFYLVVLATSTVVFSLTHQRNAFALRTLTFSLVGLAVCFGIWNIINRQNGSIGFEEGAVNLSESRLFGLLAFFPVLSLLFLIVQSMPISRWQGAAAVFQSLLFAEIIHARLSVLWLAPPLLLIAAAGLFSRSIAPSRRNSVAVLILVTLALLSKSVYQHAVYNKEYFAEKGSRTIWHNVVMGLSWNPFFVKTLGVAVTDPISARLVLRYEKSGIVALSEQKLTAGQVTAVETETDAAMNALGDYGTYDWPAHEREARRYVFAVFKAYPGEFLKTYLWSKPLASIKDIGAMFLPRRLTGNATQGASPLIYPTALGALIAALAGYFGFGVDLGSSSRGPFFAFLGLCVVFSLAISIAVYPAPTQLGDVTLVALVWGFSVVYDIARRLRGAG